MAVDIVGGSKSVLDLIRMIDRIAPTNTNVLIMGESGTGKELVARMIHEKSLVKDASFVPVNCGAIPETLIESELFGYKKGSFTGAYGDKVGLFEVANGGTLFLDEVGEIPPAMQVKLLRAIQDKTIRKVGGTENLKIDVRILAATNRDLEEQVRKGEFREDLFYRLNVIQIRTPSLRERPEDVEILSGAFLKRYTERLKKRILGFTPEAMSALKGYAWPGNVRELENVVERAVALESEELVGLETLPDAVLESLKRPLESHGSRGTSGAAIQGHGKFIQVPMPDFEKGKLQLDEVLGEVEREYLHAALQHTGGIKKKAASLLGITFRSMRYRLKKLGIQDEN